MTRGRNICNQLKAVRKSIAEENDIPLEIKECSYKGECRGTCPRCEAEVRYLENALADRLRMGKVATVAGVALGLASCSNGNRQAPQDTTETLMTGKVEETDTVRQVADTAKPIWREPDNMSDVYVGDLEVINLNDTAILEEGEVDDEPLLGCIAETEPEFPGGLEAMYKFITDNLKYPQLALENGIEGRVYINFTVEKDGTISDVRVLRDIGGGCGQEAKRVAEMMPKWNPGKQSGKPVRTSFNLPVNFVLPEDRPRIIEGGAALQGMPIDTSDYDVSPNSPTQQMEVEGVKVIVR